jgi:hypothetical protein
MADDYSSGGGESVAGASRGIEDLTVEEIITSPSPDPARPDWMVTRFPVPIEEYRRLSEEAQLPDAASSDAMAATDATSEDADAELQASIGDVPEGESAVTSGPVEAAPGFTASFQSLVQTPWRPPDNTMAVGPNHVMVAVNTDLAVYSKAGALQFKWPNMNALFGPVLPAGASLFDPRVAYDHYVGRWIVVAAARRNSPAGSWLMIGVSQGTNPAGPYWIWALNATLNGNTATNNWADYPMLGFDTQGIYIVSNMFQFGGGFQYCKLRILSKAELYAGGVGPGHVIKWYDFWNLKNPDGSVAFTIQPAVHFRGIGGNPPAYMVNAIWPSASKLTLWTLNNPIGHWIGGAASLSASSVACASYDLPPDAQQLGTGVRIETNDSRLLNAVFQYVDNVQRLWTCQTSKYTWGGDSEARSVVQWYEIDVLAKTVKQQNRYGASGKYYFYPAIQTDISRNAFVVFSRSSSSEYGQLRQTGRRVTDPQNDLQNSALVKAGEGIYTGGRWGDYFGIARDGGNSSVVWGYGEYARTGDTWGTWVYATKF